MTFSDDLRKAISDSGESLWGISQGCGVSHQVLSRFVRKERDIRLETADKLADYFKLGLSPLDQPKPKPKAKRPKR